VARRRDDDDQETYELRDIDVPEISLVGRAATGRKFLLFKSDEEGNMPDSLLTDDLAPDIEELLNTPLEGEDELLKAVEEDIQKALSDKEKSQIRGALRMLGGIDDPGIKSLVRQLAAKIGYGYAKPQGKAAGDNKDEGEEDEEKYGKRKTKKSAEDETGDLPEEILALAKSAESPEGFEAIVKAARESQAATQILIPLLKQQSDQIAELRKREEERAEREDDEEVDRLVKSLDLPVETELLTKLIKSLNAEQREQLSRVGESLGGVLELTKLTSDIGTPRRSEHQPSAVKEAYARARERLEKSGEDDKRTVDEYVLDILNEDGELRSRYLQEMRGG